MTQATQARSGADATPVNPDLKRRSFWPAAFYETAVGKKWVMALTGIGLMGYVLAHMIGNLKMYQGRADFDAYAESLRYLLYPIAPAYSVLWIMRIGLIAIFVLHIHSAFTLTRMNQRARPTRYQAPREYIAANFASRTMRWTGVIILLYVLFHLADLTFGWANPDYVYGAAYDNLVASLSRWWVSAIYIVANVALGIHLFHGGWSIFQSLGLNNPRYNNARRYFAAGFAILVAGLNISFPIAVLSGLVS